MRAGVFHASKFAACLAGVQGIVYEVGSQSGFLQMDVDYQPIDQMYQYYTINLRQEQHKTYSKQITNFA